MGLVPGATPTASGPATPVAVSLYHCGIQPITFEGERWEVPDAEEPFDATNAPAWFARRGTVGRSAAGDELVYTDESGLTLRFVPDDGLEPPCN